MKKTPDPPALTLPMLEDEPIPAGPIDPYSFAAGMLEALRLMWLWWGNYKRMTNPVYRRDFERWIEGRLGEMAEFADRAAAGKWNIPPPRPCQKCKGDWPDRYKACQYRHEESPGLCRAIDGEKVV